MSAIQRLVATGALTAGAVRFSSSIRRLERPATWDLAELQGRLVEVVGSGPTALLTTTTQLVRQAQEQREPVAWVTSGAAPFHPPDLATNGVDLTTLAVVQPQTSNAMLRAADQLLRSGAFGLVVLDFVERAVASLSVQVRLAALCKQHNSVLLCLGQEVAFSLASLRAHSRRARKGTRFTCTVQVDKDKRRGREWQGEELCRGPLGLR